MLEDVRKLNASPKSEIECLSCVVLVPNLTKSFDLMLLQSSTLQRQCITAFLMMKTLKSEEKQIHGRICLKNSQSKTLIKVMKRS